MTLLASQISALAGRFGNKIITAQVNQSVPFLGSGALQRVPMKGKTAIINIMGGGLDSTTFIADGGALSTGSQSTPSQGAQTPAALFSRLSIGRVSAYLAAGSDDGADIVKMQLENCGKDIARNAGRNIFDSFLGSPNAAVAFAGGTPAAVTLDFKDISGFRFNQAVNFVDVSTSISYTLAVQSITPAAIVNSANVAGTVVFANTVAGVANVGSHTDAALNAITVATGDLFALRGTYPGLGVAASSTATGNVMVSYADIAGTATLHGLLGTTNDWTGNTAASFGVMSAEALVAFSQRIFTRSMSDFTHAVMSPAASVAFATAQLTASTSFGMGTNQAGQARRNVDGKFDKFGAYKGSGLGFMGKPVIIDPNCPATSVVLHNDEIVKLGMWRDFEPDQDGKEAAMVDRTSLIYDIQMLGLANMICYQRNAVGLITGITNL